MKKEVLEWYQEKRFNPTKLIQIGLRRHGLTKYQIEAAMEHCYDKIVKQEKAIPQLEIGRYTFNVAKDMDSKKVYNDLIRKEKRKIRRVMYGGFGFIALANIAAYIYFRYFQ
jgi:ribosomal protein L23